MHQLFNNFGHRYDLHTPPDHYQHDHQLVLQLASELGQGCRLLDVGCGTGVLLEKARGAGIDAHGVDISPAMIDLAKRRVPAERLRVLAMQELEDVGRYDIVVSLSWSIHYCDDLKQFEDVLRRLKRALKPGGLLLLQVAHSNNFTGEWLEDKEPGPTGEAEDVILRFRFRDYGPQHAFADYAYECASQQERFSESHLLVGTNAVATGDLLEQLGFTDVVIWDSWRREPFGNSGIVFVQGHVRT